MRSVLHFHGTLHPIESLVRLTDQLRCAYTVVRYSAKPRNESDVDVFSGGSNEKRTPSQ